jgi:WD40 repeat protein
VTGKPLWTKTTRSNTGTGAANVVFALAISNDGGLVAGATRSAQSSAESTSDDVKIWKAKTGTLLHSLVTKPRIKMEVLFFSPHGKFILGGGKSFASQKASVSGAVQIWDVKSGKLVRVL